MSHANGGWMNEDQRGATEDAGIAALRRENERLRSEVERLTAWLRKIDGGDAPCTDESQLRQWAYEAVTLGRPAA